MQLKRVFCSAIAMVLLWGGQARAVVIASSTFGTDADGWTLDGSPAENFSWQSTDGNPGGFIRFVDNLNPGSNFVAPPKFLGNWSALNGTGQLTYDFRVFSTGGSVFSNGPYAVFLSGPGGAASWSGATPGQATPWIGITVPIQQSAWSVTSGNWSDLLANVTSLQIVGELFGNFDN